MGKVKDERILAVIQDALKVKGRQLSLDSSMENVEEWDSLGQLGILVALDKFFEGKVAGINDLVAADSVRKILQILKANSLM